MMTWYDILEISETANEAEIKSAYRKLAKATHPDLNNGDKTKETYFKRVQVAFETLGDPLKRAAYDLELRRSRGAARAEDSGRNNSAPARSSAPQYSQAMAPQKKVDAGDLLFVGALGLGLGALFASILHSSGGDDPDDY